MEQDATLDSLTDTNENLSQFEQEYSLITLLLYV